MIKYVIIVMLCFITYILVDINGEIAQQNMTPSEKIAAIHQQEIEDKQEEENRIKTDKQQVQFGIYISKIISLAKSDDHTFSDAYQYAMKPENNKYFSIFVDKLVIFLILMVAFSVCVYKGWKMANNSFMPRNYPY